MPACNTIYKITEIGRIVSISEVYRGDSRVSHVLKQINEIQKFDKFDKIVKILDESIYKYFLLLLSDNNNIKERAIYNTSEYRLIFLIKISLFESSIMPLLRCSEKILKIMAEQQKK